MLTVSNSGPQQLILAVTPPKPRNPPPATTTTSGPASASTSTHPGTILIAVWSLEQDPSLVGVGSARRKTGAKKGAVPVGSVLPVEDDASDRPPRGEEGDDEEQDVFVPWALQPAPQKKVKPVPPPRAPYTGPRNTEGKKKRKQLAKEAEARALAGHTSEETAKPASAPEALPIDEAKINDTPDFSSLSLSTTPTATDSSAPAAEPEPATLPPTFQRYYHLFRHGELSQLVVQAGRELSAVVVDTSEDQIAGLAREPPVAELESARGEWVREVELKCESWERENWAAQVGVQWVWNEEKGE